MLRKPRGLALSQEDRTDDALRRHCCARTNGTVVTTIAYVYYIPPPNKPMVPRETHEVVPLSHAHAGVGDRPRARPTSMRDDRVHRSSRRPIAGGRARPTRQRRRRRHRRVVGDDHGGLGVHDPRGRQRGRAVAEQRRAGLSARSASKQIEGTVLARYVVDTTGFADTTSFEVFARRTRIRSRGARRAALHALLAGEDRCVQVRQLVEQPFTFKITPATWRRAQALAARRLRRLAARAESGVETLAIRARQPELRAVPQHDDRVAGEPRLNFHDRSTFTMKRRWMRMNARGSSCGSMLAAVMRMRWLSPPTCRRM